jgi:hypothetical protein
MATFQGQIVQKIIEKLYNQGNSYEMSCYLQAIHPKFSLIPMAGQILFLATLITLNDYVIFKIICFPFSSQLIVLSS